MPKELHGTPGTGRVGSTPLRAGAQTANASAHSDAGRASQLFLHPLSPGLLVKCIEYDDDRHSKNAPFGW